MNQKDITINDIKIYFNKLELEITIKISKTFKQNDLICCANNFLHGDHYFTLANESDVKNYSGKNGYYIIEK